MKHINLTQMLQGCSKRNGMTVSASNPDGEPTVNRQSRLMSLSGKKAEKEQLSPSCLLSASFPLSFRSRYLRYAAVIFCVLAMSVGQAWADDIFHIALKAGTNLDTLTVPANSSNAVYDECTANVTNNVTGTRVYCGAYVSNNKDKEYKIGISSSAWSFSANQMWMIMYSPTQFKAGDTITIQQSNTTKSAFDCAFFAPYSAFTTNYYGYVASGDTVLVRKIQDPSSGNSYIAKAVLPPTFSASNYLVMGRNGNSFGVKYLKVTSAVAAGSGWSFLSKNSSSEWSDPIAMTEVDAGTKLTMSEEIYLPTDGVSYKVCDGDGNDETKTAETDWRYMPMGPTGTRVWTAGTHLEAANTGGAKGYVYIYSNSDDNNRYVGFIPSGYILRWGTDGGGWTSKSFTAKTSSYNEREWNTEVVTLSGSNASDKTYVAFETESGFVWNQHAETRQLIYFKPGTNWSSSDAVFSLYYWNGSGGAFAGFMTDDDGDGIYESWVPDTYTDLKFIRHDPSKAALSFDGDQKWNESGNLTLVSGKNLFTMPDDAWNGATNGTSDANWSAYSKRGRFRIDAGASEKNEKLHFIPHYFITYDANGGSEEPDEQDIAYDAAPLVLTVAAGSGMTAPTGYEFAGWNPDESSADAGTKDDDYDPGDDVTMSEDVTLYAVWKPIPVTSITVSPSSKSLEVGGTQTLTATAAPATALNKAVTWSTSDGSIATVTSEGVVTAVAPGSCTITATAKDGSEVTGTCAITVTAAAAYSVTYNANGGSGSVPTDGNTYAADGVATVLGRNTLAKDGSMFIGWRTAASSGKWYAVGQKMTIVDANVTLYAQWRTISCPSSGTMYSLTMGNVGETSNITAGDSVSLETYATIVNGTATLGNKHASDATKAKIGKANPGKIILNGNDAMLKLEFGCTLAEGDTIKFIVTDDNTNQVSITTTNAYATSPATSNLGDNYHKYYVVPAESSLIGKNVIYAWRNTSSNTRNITAVSITRPVSCTTPAAPTATSNGTTAATTQVVSWTDGSNDKWDVYVSPSSSTPAAGDTPTASGLTANTYTFTGLTASTTYYWWVRSVCDDTHKSSWFAGSSFKTSAAAGTTYYLVTSTAQLNTTDTYVIMDDGKNAMMGVYGTNVMTAITSGFTAATDKSTVTVTNSDVNTLTLQAESEAWNIVGKDDNKLTTNSTVGEKLFGNTTKTKADDKDDFVFSFADGKATIKRNTSTDYHIYYTSGTGFNQSTTATNIRLYTSNSTPVDETAPTLSSSTPEDDATGVGVSGNIVLTFSENVTINNASKFSLTGGAGTLNTASASASGKVVTIPYTGLAYNTTYTLATAAEAVKDGSNNKNVALSDITFTTLSATGSCNELNYVWQTGSSKTPKGVSKTYAEGDVAKIDNDDVATTHITISGTNYEQKSGSKGSLNTDKATDNYFLLTAASGYVIDSVYFYGKLEDGACRMSTDGSAWTTTLGDGTSTGEKVYAIGVGTQNFGLKNKDIASPKGVWIRTMMVKVCPEGTTYTVSYDTNGHGSAPDAETDIDPGSTISAPSAPTADCWTFNGWYKDRACTNVWNFAEDEVNSNITLYAKWTSNKARVKALDYGETDYTVTPDGTGDAITVTPVSASGVNYKWYSNTSDDVTGWSEIPSAETASYSPSIASVGTTYYRAVLVHECGNDTTSSVRINVAASKTDPTIAWGNVKLGGVDATPTYGGGGYTLTGTINGGDDATPTLDAGMISADGGIVITDKSVNDASKTFSLRFDVTAAFDTTQAKITNIHFSLPSNSTYNDSVFSTNLSFDKCSGGSYSTDVYVVGYTNSTGTGLNSATNKALKTTKTWLTASTPTFTDKTSTDGFEISANQSGKYWKQSNQTIISTTTGATMKMYKLGTKSLTITWTSSSLSFSKIRVFGINTSSSPSTLTVSNGTTSTTVTFAGNETGTKEVTMAFTYGSSNGVRFTTTDAKEVDALIELVPTGSDGAGTGTATELQWKSGKAPSNISGWDGEKIVKAQSDDDFTCVAEQTSATNSVGTITYASDNTDVATVNETTGEVDIVAGAAGGEATITATMARSGCFMRSTISYTISVAELACAIEPGTLTASATSKCTDATVTLTLSDYTSTGTTISWYKSGTAEPLTNGVTYTIDGATLTTAQEGTYYAKVTLDACSLTSNNVTITNKSGAASVSKLVNQWYIKQGRLTPDVALFDVADATSWTVKKGKAATAIYTSDGTTTTTGLAGVGFKQVDNIVYLEGTAPTGIDAAANDTIIITVTDACGNSTTSDSIAIHKQVATDKHELAFVTTGTNYKEKEFTEDAWTAGIKAANSTGLALYQVLKDTFKIQATNIYASDDEKKLREYYSQYDIICITDYPNTGTKGKNSKSYVDAIGSLIDIRPVLTMEAWVSGLDNWRNKGVVGTRTTPSKRQYNMYLQCKDHEIFEGVTMQQIGYGDDALFKVNMVDSTQSRYAQLDAVGKDSHATDTAALQGFTTGDMDLLALGLIDNGSGTNLQVGAERQTVMAARMMVLGINSYAMERLTDDGQTVVVNALKYLMKKNSEDISDCSNMFVGGDNEEAESTRYDWNVASHWSGNAVPDRTQKVRIVAPCVIKADEKVHVTGVVIAPNGKYNHGANTANGSLTIAAGGALIVDGKVEAATAPLYTETRPTSPSDLTIQASSTKQGALIFDNDDGETQATVEMYSPSYWEVVAGKKKKYWSYVAMPITEVPVGEYFYGAFTYLYSETSGWTKKGMYTTLYPFDGIGLSMQDGHKETFRGTLVSTENREITLTHGNTGKNMVGNSWTAPIQIANFDADDFGDATASVLIFNTGNNNEGTVIAEDGGSGTSTAGQWLTIPISVARLGGYTGLKVIPSMQAFQVNTSTETTLTLDYDKLVRDVNIASDNLTEPHRAPRKAKEEEVDIMRVRVNGENTHTDVWLLEDERFSDEFDNGWEAKYVTCDDRSAQLYAVGDPGKMAFIALPDIEGTILGFAPSRDGNEYLFTFHYIGKEEYYLNDLKLKQSVLISEDKSYSFMYEDGDTNRFYISRTRIDAPQMPTGVDNAHEGTVKAHKFIYNDKLYIMLNGRVYSAEGALVK